MFGLCDENPEANPHNPIFCGVFSLDPCYELCCGRMGQIAKTTVKISFRKHILGRVALNGKLRLRNSDCSFQRRPVWTIAEFCGVGARQAGN